jgi:DNA-binding transcriptional regulator YiaG
MATTAKIRRVTQNRGSKAKAVRPQPIPALALMQLVEGTHGGQQLAIRKMLGFTRPMFARVLVTSERNLASIEGGKQAGPAVAKSMVELRRLVNALAEVVEPETIGEWLKTPNEAFDGFKPLEVIERGEADRIWQMIYEMRSGAFL